MEIKINIDENKITSMVEEMIAKEIFENHRGLGRNARFGVHSGMEKAVKDYIYSRKDDIIERVIDRATKEIVRYKGARFAKSHRGLEQYSKRKAHPC